MKNLLYVFLLMATFTACKKKINPAGGGQQPDNPCGLPNATQTGAGVFAACINDTSWIVPDSSLKGGGIFEFNSNGGNFSGESNAGHYYYIMDFYLGNITHDSTYTLNYLNYLNNQRPVCGVQTDFNPCELPYNGITTFGQNGSVIITKADINNQILSGTFSFDMAIYDSCDTLHIRYGRFDLKNE